MSANGIRYENCREIQAQRAATTASSLPTSKTVSKDVSVAIRQLLISLAGGSYLSAYRFSYGLDLPMQLLKAESRYRHRRLNCSLVKVF